MTCILRRVLHIVQKKKKKKKTQQKSEQNIGRGNAQKSNSKKQNTLCDAHTHEQ